MNRVARWMIRLYPASWRARYGDEMEALISDTGADARTVGDLARGGMRMQLKAWPFPLLALVLGLAGLLAGNGVAWLIPNTYACQATLRLENVPSMAAGAEELQRLQMAVKSRASLTRIIHDVGLYQDEQRVTPLEDVIDEMRQAIHVDTASKLHSQDVVFNIGFAYGDRGKARKTVAALVARFQEEASNSAQPQTMLAEVAPPIPEVLDSSSLPESPVKPNRLIASMMKGIGMGSLVPANSYVSQATIGVQLSRGGISAQEEIAHLKTLVTSRKHLARIIEDTGLFRDERMRKPLEDVIDEMRRSIHVDPVGVLQQRAIVSIRFEYADRIKAQQTVTALVDAVREEALDAERPALFPASATAAPVIEILDQPSTPVNPVKPNRYVIAGAGGICGVFLAGIISLLRRRWKAAPQIAVNS